MTRRLVTGEDVDGTSFLASDEIIEATQIDLNPGATFTQLWAVDEVPGLPNSQSDPMPADWFPPPGGFRFFRFSLPASGDATESVIDDPEAAERQANEELPGLLDATFDPDVPGRHRSATLDFLYVVSGEITLLLDDGTAAVAGPGETIIQNGTFHNWENRGIEDVVIVAAAIGADRPSP